MKMRTITCFGDWTSHTFLVTAWVSWMKITWSYGVGDYEVKNPVEGCYWTRNKVHHLILDIRVQNCDQLAITATNN